MVILAALFGVLLSLVVVDSSIPTSAAIGRGIFLSAYSTHGHPPWSEGEVRLGDLRRVRCAGISSTVMLWWVRAPRVLVLLVLLRVLPAGVKVRVVVDAATLLHVWRRGQG